MIFNHKKYAQREIVDKKTFKKSDIPRLSQANTCQTVYQRYVKYGILCCTISNCACTACESNYL